MPPEKRKKMSEIFWALVPVFFLISLAYSSVGLGGGSSYVAFLYLFGIPLAAIPQVALFLNIIVASVALVKFGRNGYFRLRKALPFLVASVPATYFAARWQPDKEILTCIFAAALFLVALMLLFKRNEVRSRYSLSRKTMWLVSLLVGTFLGFLAGVMGIGGGVFLGPLLLLTGFTSPKSTAGICSAFVLVNSSVGLLSHYSQGKVVFSGLFLLGLAVFTGAQLGSFFGAKKLSPLVLQRIFAFLLLAVSLKLGIGILG